MNAEGPITPSPDAYEGIRQNAITVELPVLTAEQLEAAALIQMEQHCHRRNRRKGDR